MLEDLQEGTKVRLNKLLQNGENYDQLINRILDENEKRLVPHNDGTEAVRFMEIFSKLSGPNKDDVKEGDLIAELVDKLRISEFAAKAIISKAKQGPIYERRAGFTQRPNIHDT